MNKDMAVPDGNQYHDDFHAWALDQAEKLRVASSAQVEELEGIDFEHVIEEVEDLGISERRQVSSNLGVALEHMIKVASLPGTDFVPGWRREIIAAIRNARRSFTPSMSQRLDVQKIWLEAREDALQILIDDGVQDADIPKISPLTLEEMLNADMPALQLLAIVMESIPTDRLEL